jgi:hypothetical protein
MAIDVFSFPKTTGNAVVFYFQGSSAVSGSDWIVWEKPRGKSMVDILLVGKGGNGGAGAIGAVSTAAGGGGGGSGSQTRLTMPLALLPDYLYISLAGVSLTTTLASYITIQPKLTAGAGAPAAQDTLVIAGGGANGGNATGATPGTLGAGGSIATAGTMPIGWNYATALAGHSGLAGNATGAGAAQNLPLTGILVCGGTGGAGLGNAGSTGAAGGALTGAGAFPTLAGGTAAGSQTAPPGNGQHGYRPIAGLMFGYSGTGGGSTGGASTGAGLFQSSGGNGAPGCGGGGSGGAFTGSAAGTVGLGGPAFCVITVW